MSRLRIGVVGGGSMGALHARVISTSPLTTLAWVSDPNRAAANAVAERFGVPSLPEPDLGTADAIVIAAPTQYHHEIGLRVLDAGLPMLMEKPLSNDLAEARELVARSSEADVPLMCGFLERFNPAVRTAFDIAERPVHLRTARHSPYVERIRTGVASDLLIHDADLAIRLFGSAPTAVSGQPGFFHPRSAPGSEDVVEAVMVFAANEVASLSASRLSQRKVREMVIVEEDRMIEVDLLRQDITIYRHVGDSTAIDDDGLGYRQQTIIDIPVIRHIGEPLSLQLARFVDLVRGRVDAAEERDTLLASHVAVDQVLAAGAPIG